MKNQLHNLLNEILASKTSKTMETLCVWAKELEEVENPDNDLLPGSYKTAELFLCEFVRLTKLIRSIYGDEVTAKLMEIINIPSCPYPWEMVGTAKELAAGASIEAILKMQEDGSLEDFHDYHRTPPGTEKRFSLTICDPFDPIAKMWVLNFRRNDDVEDPNAAIRAAVKEFTSSNNAESVEALRYAQGRFNWSDVVRYVPNQLFMKYGLELIEKYEIINASVDRNEILSKSKDFNK